jgi:hypothetical protein
MDKDGTTVNKPPLLDGTNYDYWKPRMIAFLKSLDSRTWKAVLKGWEHPKILDANGVDTGVLKLEEDWSAAEDTASLGNSKALNALFNGVDKNMFRLIKQCTVAKNAWEILRTTHEGNAKVKSSRIQLLNTKFENLRMKEEESIHDFHMNLLEVDNSFEALGEKLSEEKLVRKMLRSLPKRFNMKITAIEEAQDIPSMKLEELVSSLQTFEMNLGEQTEKKGKGIAFVSCADEEEEADESDDDLSNDIAMLGRQFNKLQRRVDRRPRRNVRNIQTDISKLGNTSTKTKTDDKSTQNKGVQCHECEGFGHIRTECGTYLKRQKKGLTVSWSDEDSDTDSENVAANHVSAMADVCSTDVDSDDEELTFNELASVYKKLSIKSEELCRINEEQKVVISQLETEKAQLQNQVVSLESEVTVNQLEEYDQVCKDAQYWN